MIAITHASIIPSGKRKALSKSIKMGLISSPITYNNQSISSSFFLGFAAGVSRAIENPGDDPLQWLRDSIPGEPGVDYPIFSSVEETGFSCEGRIFGGRHQPVVFKIYKIKIVQ